MMVLNVEGHHISPILLVTGGTGTGKRYIVDVLDGVSKIMAIGEQTHIAFLGIAALTINEFTLIKLLDMPLQQKKDKQSVRGWSMRQLETFKNMFDLVTYQP